MAQNDVISVLNNMLDYFNELHKSDESSLQAHKTELFEITVRLDELNKTKNVYSMNSSYRKNVFSPIIKDAEDTEKQSEIENEIESLNTAKAALDDKILNEEISLKSIETKISDLENAKKSLESFEQRESESDKKEIEALKYECLKVEAEAKLSAKAELMKHGQNILMLDAFEKSFYSTILDNRVIKELSSNNHKLEMLRYLITTNPEKAKEEIDRLIETDVKIAETLGSLLRKMHYDFDDSKAIALQIDSLIMKFRDRHPEYVLESNVICDDDQKLSYIKALSLVNLLEIFLDNIAKHSDATQINIYIEIDNDNINATIKDNGNGINNDYLNKYPWYSSLHKAYETIYLLNGKLDIHGEDKLGTTVIFSYSIK
jgi:two-component system sensor histidine kinase DegS